MHGYLFVSKFKILCRNKPKPISKLLPNHITNGYAIMLLYLLIAGTVVEICSSPSVTVFNEQSPIPVDESSDGLISKMMIGRASIFFSILAIDMCAGKMYTVLYTLLSFILCINGDENKVNRVKNDLLPL